MKFSAVVDINTQFYVNLTKCTWHVGPSYGIHQLTSVRDDGVSQCNQCLPTAWIKLWQKPRKSIKLLVLWSQWHWINVLLFFRCETCADTKQDTFSLLQPEQCVFLGPTQLKRKTLMGISQFIPYFIQVIWWPNCCHLEGGERLVVVKA